MTTDFYRRSPGTEEETALRVARKRRIARSILLCTLLYCIVLDILYYFMPESRFIYYLRPFSVTNALPAVYPALYYGMCLLSVLPLLGWLLLRRGKRVGKPLIVVPYVTAWVVISTFTFLHCVYALRAYSFPQVYATLLEAVSFLPFGFGVPILLHLWQQK